MYMKYNNNIIRPANFDRECPGKGSMILKTEKGISVGIINIIGRVYMPIPFDSPFTAVERELRYIREKADIIIVDTDDAVLICSKNNTQDVKKVIAKLNEQGRTNLV